MVQNLRQFVQILRNHAEIVDIYEEVDSQLELAEIHRRVIEKNGPALFFHKVKGSSFPIVTNLYGSDKRVSLAFQNQPEKIIEGMVSLIREGISPKNLWKKRSLIKSFFHVGFSRKKKGSIKECRMPEVDLEKLPLLKTWPLDGGSFMTLPLVYTENKGTSNLGMYRIQRFNKNQTGLHFQIGKGGGFHYHVAEQENRALPVNIFLGGSPALTLSAIAPLPENLSELLLASLMQGKKLTLTNAQESSYPLIAECEFALIGSSQPFARRAEGPFGDHYGYYSWIHDFPVFDCHAIYHRKNAIYPATIVGKPYQEDYFIGNYLQKLLSPLFPMVMPGVKDLWSYGETGFHSLAAAIVHERYHRECMHSGFRILGEGQLALTKFLLLTDQKVALLDFKKTLTTILERFQPETDLFVFSNLSLDTLDYTGPELNKGSRGIMIGTGEIKKVLPREYLDALPERVSLAIPFCPGCLVIQASSYETFSDFSSILHFIHFQRWPLIILVDDAAKTVSSECQFLWTVFTRFEPGADIHAHIEKIHRHHPIYKGPILIDARMKPSYPPEVAVDPETFDLVSKKWLRYSNIFQQL